MKDIEDLQMFVINVILFFNFYEICYLYHDYNKGKVNKVIINKQ